MLHARAKNQAATRQKSRTRKPRKRHCLLKGCEHRFHPRQARQRYCSAECGERARQWSRWKAQQKYRKTRGGKQRRNGQSGRYRERVKSRKPPEPEAVSERARVITQEHFFRAHLRPARLLRALRARAAKSVAALLLRGSDSRASVAEVSQHGQRTAVSLPAMAGQPSMLEVMEIKTVPYVPLSHPFG